MVPQPPREDEKEEDKNPTTATTTKNGAPVQLSAEETETAIANFCQYLRFATVSATAASDGTYRSCAEWILSQLQQIPAFSCDNDDSDSDEKKNVFFLEESPSNAPVVVAYWKGRDPTLPILLLNSHYDVVPAPTSDWTVPPFDGLRRNQRIYGRGTQDMKCVGMQYIEAIRKIGQINPTWRPQRSIYLTYVPDEEIGGAGMACFLDSKLYKSLPGISLALDEGLASTTESFEVFYGERIPWFVSVTAHGPTGHGSRFIENTAVEQLLDLCNKALAFRQGQRELLHGGSSESEHHNCAHAVAAAKERKQQQQDAEGGETQTNKKTKNLGDVTSLNITSIEAGVKAGGSYTYNCVPPTAQCSLDIRISPNRDPSEIGDMLDLWCRECSLPVDGHDGKDNKPIEWKYLGRGHDSKQHSLTSCDPQQNAWYGVFETTLVRDMGYPPIQPRVFPAATDSRFLRALGIRAFGFSPMRSTSQTPCPILLHENDEYIPEATFIEGIHVYIGLIQALGSQGKEMD